MVRVTGDAEVEDAGVLLLPRWQLLFLPPVLRYYFSVGICAVVFLPLSFCRNCISIFSVIFRKFIHICHNDTFRSMATRKGHQ